MKKAIQPTDLSKHLEKWETNRRKFLKGALLAGAMSQITWFTSCTDQLKAGNHILTSEQSTILDCVLITFFPNDGNGPSANDINAFGYIMWVLDDSLNRKTSENQFIIDGILKLDTRSLEMYQTSFIELDSKKQAKVIDAHTTNKQTRKWCAAIISLIFEALLLDPIYGGNVNEKGWEWLNHTPGFPRPSEKNRYEVIMAKQLKHS